MARKKTEGTSKTKIYDALRREIITGHRRPGERLAVEALAERFSTSVTPVRDALQMLSQEALVTIKPRSGYFVTRITLKALRDMLDLREVLEVAATERAAARISEAEIAALEAVHAGYSGDDDESYARYTDENRRFHYLLARASGNRELSVAVGQIHDRLARFMVIRKGGEILQAAHGQVIERLAEHDVAGARKAIQSEIRASSAAIIERVMQADAENWELGTAGDSD